MLCGVAFRFAIGDLTSTRMKPKHRAKSEVAHDKHTEGRKKTKSQERETKLKREERQDETKSHAILLPSARRRGNLFFSSFLFSTSSGPDRGNKAKSTSRKASMRERLGINKQAKIKEAKPE